MKSYLINAILTYIIIVLLLAILKPYFIFKNKFLSFPLISVIISIIIYFSFYKHIE